MQSAIKDFYSTPRHGGKADNGGEVVAALHLEGSLRESHMVRQAVHGSAMECDLERISDADTFKSAIVRGGFDLIFLSWSAMRIDRHELLETGLRQHPDRPVIVLDESDDVDTRAEVLDAGAFDYVPMERADRLPAVVQRAMRFLQGLRSLERLHRTLAAREDWHRLLVEQVRDYAIFTIDVNGRVSSWNRGVERVLGFTEDEFPGMPVARFFTPEDVAADVPGLELRTAAEEGQASNDRWMMRRDGSRFWASGTTTALRDEEGNVIGYTKVMRDLTERMLTAEALKTSEAGLNLALDAGRMGTWIWDLAKGSVDWSPQLRAIHGLPPGAFLSTIEAAMNLIHPDDRERVEELVTSALDGELENDQFIGEYRIIRPSGEAAWIETRGRVLRDAQQEPMRIVGVALDITERKQVENELRRHREQLEVLVEARTRELDRSQHQLRQTERLAAIGTLSAGLGHDMGNLLLPLRIRLDSMESRNLPPEFAEDVHAIKTSAEYLQRLSSGLRLLATDPEVGVGVNEPVDLHEWWRDVDMLMRHALPRGVNLEARIPGPPEHEPIVIGLARPALTQAIFNLVQNAGDALRDREGGEVVVAATQPSEDVVQIEVSDNGPGMTEDVRRRCMEPFFTTKTRGISTGLGLALTHAVITKAGGSIEIDSEIGRGTTFRLKVPAGRVVTSVRRNWTAAVSVAHARIHAFIVSVLRSLHVIVVENADEPGVNLLVADAGDGRVRSFLDGRKDGEWRLVLVGEAEQMPKDDERIASMASPPKAAEVWRTLRKAVHGGADKRSGS